MIAQGRLRRLRRGGSVARPRAATRSRGGRRVPRRRARVLVACAAVVALLGGVWLWLRDSSLVAVDRVAVTGISGPDAGQIRQALTAAARNMTTLDVHMNQLRTAVAPYPVVKDLKVSTQFPHGMRIRVVEQIPVGAVTVGGRSIAVAGDGTLLHDVAASASLPAIPLRVVPGGTRVSDPQARAALAVLAAAPYQLLSRISQVSTDPSHGLVAQLRSGPSIYFGNASRLSAKWIAATAVLADAGSAGASYIDVTDPERPAAGADSSSSSGTSSAGTSTSATGSGSTGSVGSPSTSGG
jgi:cell division protein FtsQ